MSTGFILRMESDNNPGFVVLLQGSWCDSNVMAGVDFQQVHSKSQALTFHFLTDLPTNKTCLSIMESVSPTLLLTTLNHFEAWVTPKMNLFIINVGEVANRNTLNVNAKWQSSGKLTERHHNSDTVKWPWLYPCHIKMGVGMEHR